MRYVQGPKPWQHARVIILVMVGFFVFVPSAVHAGTGYVPDPNAFREAPEWQPPATGGGYGVTPVVDLRNLLPPVGQQGNLNSCVGWTVAYAMKSGQETLDQGWRPDHAKRQFSPAFLWNQLNGGRNQGTSINRALKMLSQQGCSTLAAMPVRSPQDVPSAPARREAQLFRIRRFTAVRSAAAIKAALRHEHVVVLGIKTDPVFMTGRFEVFTRQHRIRGEQEARRQPQYNPHRGHALACVGYDDTRRAFLLMNSWGRTWGKQGYCWVSYDLMGSVPNAPAGALDRLVIEAYVAEDVRRRVTGPAPTSREVQVVGRSTYVGNHDGRPKWDLRIAITGTDAALRGVGHVALHWRDQQGREAHRTITDASGAFGMTVTVAGQGEVTVRGNVVFRDGTTRAVSHTFRMQRSTYSSIGIEQDDSYVGRVNGTPTWEWTLRLTGNLVDLGDVQEVTYHLHPTFPNPNRRVTQGPANGFALTQRGWGTFQVRATVRFKNGSTKMLQHKLQWKSPAQDRMVLNNTSRYAGFSNGQHWWYWSAYVQGPLDAMRAVQHVTYQLHPTFPSPVRMVTGGAEMGFPLETIGWGTFKIAAIVTFRNGKTLRLDRQLEFEPAPSGRPQKQDMRRRPDRRP